MSKNHGKLYYDLLDDNLSKSAIVFFTLLFSNSNQKGYAFTSENYIYVYTFSSDSDLTNNETLKSTINSFKILDKTIEDKSLLNNKLLFSLIVGASIGLIGFIISILIKRR